MANSGTVQKEWVLVDAENLPVGRLASVVAMLARGKHKPIFTPHADCGDHVVVINAEKVRFTGAKWEDKEYQRYSGHPGGQTRETAKRLMSRKPTAVVELAVKGMLPKTKLGRAQFGNVHVVAGTAHKHEAQKPRTIDPKTIK